MASDAPGYAVGLDLGDGESALAFCSMDPGDEPEVFRQASMPTAICRRRSDATRAPLIGIDAVANEEGVELNVNFKVDPATEPDRWRNNRAEVLLFAEVLFEQFAATESDVARSCRLFIGCPAGWSKEGQALYQKLFEGSSVLPPSEVVREPRSALVQAWEFEGLPTKALEDRVVLIDVGSSTTDVSVVDGRVARDHPVGADLGLADLDRAVLAELIARAKDPKHLAEWFRDAPSKRLLMLYLCRMYKERSFGAERDVNPILAGREWAPPLWKSMQSIDAVDLFRRGPSAAAIPWLESDAAAIPWLERFRELLTGLTGPRGVVSLSGA